ncbi:YjbH domain-containing protein [Primorskyibacter sedentarius]|uniref:YjbH domain-containing protein n=1 Tax=Primorskyibacter sedentarius TaxID=745311 RepID=UPI003EBF6AC6
MTQPGTALKPGPWRRRTLHTSSVIALLTALPTTLAQAQEIPGYNLYGSPGLIDMPTAGPAPDATLGVTVSRFGDNTRTTLNFQIAPRLSGSFRYSAIDNFPAPGNVDGRYFDRSFDLRYELLTETPNRPAITVGLQDFIGTGLYGGEYLVATKELFPGLRVTGGLGWGRLGSFGDIGSTGNRPDELLGEGGIPTYDRWFRGDVAPFGGVSYSPNKNLSFKLEYSSDDYAQESTTGEFDKKSPWNYGIDYRFNNGTQLSLYHVYGSEVGAQVTLFTNPKHAQVPGGSETAPLPVAVRSPAAAQNLGWTTDSASTTANAKTALKTSLEREGLVFEGLALEPRRATVRLRNPKYGATPQAIGRTARAMSRVLPGSVEEFVIVPVVNGMALSAVSIRRSDLETLENDAATEILARTRILDGYNMAPAPEAGIYPRFTWSLSPYVALSAFDPDNPVRADAGLRLGSDIRILPNVVLSGAVTKKLGGNLDEVTREDPSGLPRVRTDYAKYSKEGDPAIEHLTASVYGRPATDLYSRVTVGYLEQMYAGVSGELLWKKVDSPLALGVEMNFVKQRDFDQMFGLRDYEVATGHASAYYDFGNGFHGQLDVGRYLAGDYGATVALDREFANGWRVGAYATFTDVSYDDFGEGSFDKGIRLSIPLGWVLGQPSRQANNAEIKSLTRDGGARLNVDGRLYEQVRDYHRPEMAKTWGRFWR